jgi:predicted transport protein
MPTVEEQLQTQIANIERSSGRTMAEWRTEAAARGLAKHGQIVAWLKTEHGMSHGNANRVALEVLKPVEAPTGDAQIDAIYSGRNAGVRALHDRVVETVLAFGPDVELAPKKSYVSLRRNKQFGMVGPASGGRLEVCLNLPDAPIEGRMVQGGGMLARKVQIRAEEDFDAELKAWLREAYDRS